MAFTAFFPATATVGSCPGSPCSGHITRAWSRRQSADRSPHRCVLEKTLHRIGRVLRNVAQLQMVRFREPQHIGLDDVRPPRLPGIRRSRRRWGGHGRGVRALYKGLQGGGREGIGVGRWRNGSVMVDGSVEKAEFRIGFRIRALQFGHGPSGAGTTAKGLAFREQCLGELQRR